MKKSNRVALVNSNRIRPPIAPIGLDYLAPCLEREGFEIAFLDLSFEQDVPKGLDRVLQSEPVAVGISVRNLDDSYCASGEFFLPEIRALISEVRKRTGAPVVLGGVGYSIAEEEALRFCEADFGVAGDGELAFTEFLLRLQDGVEPGNVPGLLAYANGEVFRTVREFPSLSSMPSPTRPLLDNRRYFKEGGQAGVETKRGCPCGCTFCADPLSKGNRVRLRPPNVVVQEFKTLLAQGIDTFHLCDSEFNIPLAHAKAVCREMINSGLGDRISWYTYASPVPVDAELISLMKSAGCVGINFGADHAVESMLKRMGRDFTSTEIREVTQLCQKASITVMFDLLLGFPGETEETIRTCLEFYKGLPADCFGISAGVRIYDNTALVKWLRASGSLEDNEDLRGEVKGNPGLLQPVFFASKEFQQALVKVSADVIGDDPRFFVGATEKVESNYNYNENSVLSEAIGKGARGAYWDILRKIRQGDH